MRNDLENNLIIEKTFDFSLEVMHYCEQLTIQRRYKMSDQLFRSATSIGANVREAQNAESKRDFLHKMKIAAKEIDETQYWLELCEHSGYYESTVSMQQKLEVIGKILNKIISTTKKSLEKTSSNLQID